MSIVLLLTLAGAFGPRDEPMLRPGEPIDAVITDEDPVVETTKLLEGGYTRQHAVLGRTYRLEVDARGPYHIDLHSLAFDAYLVLRDADGTLVAEDDDGLWGRHARVVTELDPGRPMLVQACALHGQRGAFALTVGRGRPPELHASARAAHEIQDARVKLAELEGTLGPDHPDVAGLQNSLGIRLQSQGDYSGARRLYEQALQTREKVLGGSHRDVAVSLSNLGGVLQRQGELAAARPLFERSVSILASLDPPQPRALGIGWNNLALLLQEQGDHAAARPLFERSLAAFESALGATHPLVASTLTNLAVSWEVEGRPEMARPLFERALALQEQALGPGDPSVALTLNGLAGLHMQADQWTEARTHLERALAIDEASLGPDHPETAMVRSNLGLVLRELGEFVEARRMFEEALPILEDTYGPRSPKLGSTLNNLATLLEDLGEYAQARVLQDRCLAIAQASLGPDHEDLAVILLNAALLSEAEGDYATARRQCERALAIRERVLGREHPAVAMAARALGAALQFQGDLVSARTQFERAIDILEAAEPAPRSDLATCLNSLGGLLLAQSDPEKALPLFRRALELRKLVYGSAHPVVAEGLNNLAIASSAAGDLASAEDLLRQALALFETAEGPSPPDVATCIFNLGMMAKDRGDDAAALPLLERAAARFEDSLGAASPQLAKCLRQLAGIRQQRGEGELAYGLYERALAIREAAFGSHHQDVTQSLFDLAMFHVDAGQAERGRELLLRAIRGRDAHLGPLLARLSEAEGHACLRALRWQQELALSPAFGGTESAAIETYESLLSWKARVLRIGRLGRARLRQQMPPESLATLDRLSEVSSALSRSASLVLGDPLGALPPRIEQLLQERSRLERSLLEVAGSSGAAAPTWSQVQRALPSSSAFVDVFAHRVYVPSRRAVDGTLEVPGGWSEPRLGAWITRSEAEAPIHVDLGPLRAVEDAIRALRESLEGLRGEPLTARPDVEASVRRLLWDPIAVHLADVDLVIVSPDGVIGTIPYEIIRDERGRHLVEDRGFVSMADSAVLLETAQGGHGRGGQLLAVGGVDFSQADPAPAHGNPPPSAAPIEPAASSRAPAPTPDSSSTGESTLRGHWTDVWGPLRHTLTEVNQVAARHEASFHQDAHTRLTGSAATEEALKQLLPRASIAHLATHGYFNPEGLSSLDASAHTGLFDPGAAPGPTPAPAPALERHHPGLLSGLVCAGVNAGLPEGRDDGYLTAEEVAWLDLSSADLIVLSACDTGLGRAESGDGLIGLRRAFFMAGARTVVSSLWSVPDQETADLMDRFYRNLWQRGMGKYEALRAAQLETIAINRERFAHARPLTWGAFVLDGDWR